MRTIAFATLLLFNLCFFMVTCSFLICAIICNTVWWMSKWSSHLIFVCFIGILHLHFIYLVIHSSICLPFSSTLLPIWTLYFIDPCIPSSICHFQALFVRRFFSCSCQLKSRLKVTRLTLDHWPKLLNYISVHDVNLMATHVQFSVCNRSALKGFNSSFHHMWPAEASVSSCVCTTSAHDLTPRGHAEFNAENDDCFKVKCHLAINDTYQHLDFLATQPFHLKLVVNNWFASSQFPLSMSTRPIYFPLKFKRELCSAAYTNFYVLRLLACLLLGCCFPIENLYLQNILVFPI